MYKISALIISVFLLASCTADPKQNGPEDLKLKNFRPVPVYHVPESVIQKPAFPLVDMHSHDYAASEEEIAKWIATMDSLGIEKTVILTMQTGAGFDTVVAKYAPFADRFELWCGIDYTGYDSDPGWTRQAIKELERCHSLGAKGVGELGDKGEGLLYSKPTPAYGLHPDHPDMVLIWDKCAELKMPVSIHMAEPIWMYETMDSTNDGLMNAWNWQVDLSKETTLDHAELMTSLERTLENNPSTTFIACHFANCSYDLSIVGNMLDRYPNLWADIAARYAETAPIPRHSLAFYERYQDRLLYGTDMGMEESMYLVTFRILESEDEHFYENELFGYHWPLNGFGLPESILQKLYYNNQENLYKHL